jgi:radical SAM protein with 4Fe4S-binding SPASM domain
MEKRYCAAPWRGLHINPRGDVKTCCAGDPNMLGNLNEKTIDEILNGQQIQEIRDIVRQGTLHPEYCRNCIEAERYGSSERQWHNNISPDVDYSTDDHRPALIDARWNITCNLSCNYCGPKCSSKWAGMMKIHHHSGVRPYYEQVCDYIDQYRDSVREVALVGGEPLLLSENQRLLSSIPKDAVVTLITNLNVDFKDNKIVEKLRQRSRVGWSMSFDNIGEKFEYVRSGGNWSLLSENVKKVKTLTEVAGHWGGIHAVYNLYNCTRLCELREYANQEGFSIQWQTLHQPDCLDPAMHAPWVRELAQLEIKNYQSKFDQTPLEVSFFNAVLDRLDTIDPDWEMVAVRFREHTHLIETKYHTKDLGGFQNLWPELAEI